MAICILAVGTLATAAHLVQPWSKQFCQVQEAMCVQV